MSTDAKTEPPKTVGEQVIEGATAAIEDVIKSFARPPVSVGMAVLWFDQGNPRAKPYPALVVEVLNKGEYIEVWVPTAMATGQRKRCCRYIGDPGNIRQKVMLRRDGCWDHTEFNKILLRQTRMWSDPTTKES